MVMKQTIVVTGAAGYVGEMVCHRLLQREDVGLVIGIDKSPQTDFLKALDNFIYIEKNLADNNWQTDVSPHQPTAIVHTAWQIRSLYGQADEQWRWNIVGSDAVFHFAFSTPSIKKLIHFSTAASYGASSDNTLDYYFSEQDPLRDDGYAYADEKKQSEERLQAIYTEARNNNQVGPQIFVVRPAAITGPRGRYLRVRFGLQSALQGNLEKNFLNKLVTSLTAVMPVTKLWVRQFIHEDDVYGIVQTFLCDVYSQPFMIFNIVPDSPPVRPEMMAKAVKKRAVILPVGLIRIVFWLFWHLTRGRIPTGPHVWRFYSYPIVMSGKKLAMVYQCQYTSIDAITYTDGFYESSLPEQIQQSKPRSQAVKD
jgi:nucleoside-diphosphate-sugar epimerase